eukprot:gene447-biopygen472
MVVPDTDEALHYWTWMKKYSEIRCNASASGKKDVKEKAHIVNRRGVRAELLPREKAPACVVTRDRNKEIIREQQAAKRAVREAKRGGQIDGQDNARGIPDAVVVTPVNRDEMGNNTQQAAEPKSQQDIRTRAKEAKEVKLEPSGVAAPMASATETIAQPKRVLTVAQCSRSNPAAAESDDDSSVGDNLENWEGQPTVSWNEDTVTVVHRWSSGCSLNDDEDQVADLLEEHTANSVVECAVLQKRNNRETDAETSAVAQDFRTSGTARLSRAAKVEAANKLGSKSASPLIDPAGDNDVKPRR